MKTLVQLLRPRPVLLHIPKCGGTSVRSAIMEALRQAGVADDRLVHVRAKESRVAARAAGVPLYEYRDRLLRQALAREETAFVTGHFRFYEATAKRFADSTVYVALLREPVAQFVSHYFYNRYHGTGHHDLPGTLDEFLATDRARSYGESYPLMLGGCDRGRPLADRVDEAIENLGRIPVLGLVDGLEAFGERFRDMFGYAIDIGRLNRNPRPEPLVRAELTREARDRILELTEPNRRVYEAARSLLRSP